MDSKFLFAQYNVLTKRTDALLNETNTLGKYALIGSVAFCAWFMDNHFKDAPPLLLFLPTILCIVLGIRVLVLTDLIIETGEFISRIEAALGATNENGWELNMLKQRKDFKKEFKGKEGLIISIAFRTLGSNRFLSAVLFWLTLTVVTCCIPIVVLKSDKNSDASHRENSKDRVLQNIN